MCFFREHETYFLGEHEPKVAQVNFTNHTNRQSLSKVFFAYRYRITRMTVRGEGLLLTAPYVLLVVH